MQKPEGYGCFRLLCGALAVLLTACSSGGRQYSAMEESLTLEVLPNSSKLFVYRLAAPADSQSLVQVYHPGNLAAASRQRQTEPLGESALRKLRRDAERAIQLTGYCREGFMELDHRLSHQLLWLKGECRESANAQEAERYAQPSQVAIPAPES